MNNKILYIITALLVIIVVWMLFFRASAPVNGPETNGTTPEDQMSDEIDDSTPPSHEQAELTAYNFILDFIAASPPQSNAQAATRAYNVLSNSAKLRVAQNNIQSELEAFINVTGAPEQGASVEDLQVPTDRTATLIVGMNYESGRIIREVNLVVENGQWKVNTVTTPAQKN